MDAFGRVFGSFFALTIFINRECFDKNTME